MTTEAVRAATEPDWSRETPRKWWDPPRRLMRAIRKYQNAGNGGLGSARRRWWLLHYRFWSVVTQAEIGLRTSIGGGLLLPHPNGIVIHPDVVIGHNCLIFQQVTIGTVTNRTGVPTIGCHVDIGAGARILGPVRIGDHAMIGANSVVLNDVPAGCVAVGAPARLLAARPGSAPSGAHAAAPVFDSFGEPLGGGPRR